MEDEINLLDYGRVILKWKKTIAVFVFGITFSSVLISLILPKVYKAEATIMPVGGQRGGGLATAAAQLGIGGLLGGLGSISSSATQLLVILRSRTLAERMIEKYDLIKVFYPEGARGKEQGTSEEGGPTMEDAVKVLLGTVSFMEDKKTQLISISAVMKDPKGAADLVNGYLDELAKYINENAFTVAKRNRIFIEKQLERNKTDLLESGKELTEFYAANRISNIVPRVDVNVAIGDRQEAIGERQEAMGERFKDNADSLLPRAPSLLPAAWAEVGKKTEELQKKADEINTQIQRARVVKDVPQQVYLQYLSLRRELLGQVNALLTQQYEIAKIDEAKEDLNFQVIDWARVPIKRFKPKRRQIVMTAFVMSFFFVVFYVFFREYLKKMGVGKEV